MEKQINAANKTKLNKLLKAASEIPAVETVKHFNPKLPLFAEIAEALSENKIIHADLNSVILKYFKPSIEVEYIDGDISHFTQDDFDDFDDFDTDGMINIDICGILELTDPETKFNDSNIQYISGHVILIGNASSMFFDTADFQGGIHNWDTSRVTDMSYMFSHAENFNGNIDNWDTSQVTNMGGMFHGAKHFNGNIDNWDTSQVTNMAFMFSRTEHFNGNIGGWDTSQVTDMGNMFRDAKRFNSYIGEWNTSRVNFTSSMFMNAIEFDQDISNWSISQVKNINDMFAGAVKFKGKVEKYKGKYQITYNKN